MKTKLLLLLGLATALVLFGCSRDSKEPEPEPKERVLALFKTDIEEYAPYDESQVVKKQWSYDENPIGMFMVTAGSALSSKNILEDADNKSYKVSMQGGLVPSSEQDKIYYPLEGKVDFIAYHPFLKAINNYEYAIGVEQQDNITDLLWNKTANQSSNIEEVKLTFSHTLSKMVLNLALTNEFDGQAVATVVVSGMNTKGVVNLNDGLLYNAGNIADIDVTAKTELSYEAIILPQSGTIDDRKVTISIGGEDIVWVIPSGQKFPAGKIVSFDLTVGKIGLIVCDNVTISDWTIADVADANIKLPLSKELKVSWAGYMDSGFEGVEFKDATGKLYSMAVDYQTGKLSKLIELPKTPLKEVWVTYLGNKTRVPETKADNTTKNFSFSNNILNISYTGVIGSPAHLKSLANCYNNPTTTNANKELEYYQVCDIDFGEMVEFIGNLATTTNYGKAFQSKYDGGGHTIFLSTKAGNAAGVGLFSVIYKATISNLFIDSSATASTHVGNTSGFGLFCGYSVESTFISCVSIGEMSGTAAAMGGICGASVKSKFIDCINRANVFSSNGSCGGIVGLSKEGSIINSCLNLGNLNSPSDAIAGTDALYWGGICGQNNASEISNCVNRASFILGFTTGRNNSYFGGIVGANTNKGVVKSCVNKGDIESLYLSIGGIVGHDIPRGNIITQCSNSGNLSGSNSVAYIGGICASAIGYYNGEISRSYNIGRIKSTNESRECDIGGIFGYITGDAYLIRSCWNSGLLLIHNGSVGGIGGVSSSCRVIGCYSISEPSITNNVESKFIGAICGQIAATTISHCYHSDSKTPIVGSLISSTVRDSYQFSAGKWPSAATYMHEEVSIPLWNTSASGDWITLGSFNENIFPLLKK